MKEQVRVSHLFTLLSRLRVVPHFSSGIVERTKRERAWKSTHARKGDTWRGERKKCRLFSRGVTFTRARVSLALLSLGKNGGLLVAYDWMRGYFSFQDSYPCRHQSLLQFSQAICWPRLMLSIPCCLASQHMNQPLTHSSLREKRSPRRSGQRRRGTAGVNLIQLLQVYLQVWLLFSDSKTTATLVNYTCKSFIKLTPEFPN